MTKLSEKSDDCVEHDKDFHEVQSNYVNALYKVKYVMHRITVVTVKVTVMYSIC